MKYDIDSLEIGDKINCPEAVTDIYKTALSGKKGEVLRAGGVFFEVGEQFTVIGEDEDALYVYFEKARMGSHEWYIAPHNAEVFDQ